MNNSLNKNFLNAIKNNYLTLFETILFTENFNPTFDNNKAFLLSCRLNRFEMVQILLKDKRIDPTFPNFEGLKRTLFFKGLETLDLLLNDSRFNHDIDQHDLFITACLQYNKPIIKYLNDRFYHLSLKYNSVEKRDGYYLDQIYQYKPLRKSIIYHLNDIGLFDTINDLKIIDNQEKINEF